jgi:putative peptidoglycan lipid II flippase
MVDESKSSKSLGRRMGLAAVILSVSILLSKILGFLRDAIVTTWHGAGAASDAYYAAFTLPEVMNYFLAGGTLSITFIPLFSSYMNKGNEEGGWRLFSIVATTIGALLLIASIILEFAAPQLVPILYPGFDDPEQLALTVAMTRIVIPAQLAFYIGGLLQATLFVRETFWPSALSPLIYNLCIILGGVLLEPWFGIQGFAVGVLIGALLGPLGLPLFASWKHLKYRPLIDFADPGFRRFVVLTLPLMLGATLVTVDEWLLKVFGSLSEDGAITWLNHSRKLMMVLFAVIGQAAGQAALPYLSKLFVEGKEEEMGEMLATSLQRVVFLSIIGAAGLIALSEPIVYALYHRGEFTVADANQTATLLVLFSLGMTSWASQSLAVRGFYARQDTLTPMIVGFCVLAVSAPVYWLLHQNFGVEGLAMATTIGITLNVLAIVFVYRWRAGLLPLGGVLRGLLRGLLFGALGGVAAKGTLWMLTGMLDRATFMGAALELVAGSVAFGVLAGGAMWLMRPPEIEVVMEKVRRKLKRGA